MQLTVKVENPSKISRKLKVTIPGIEVTKRLERGYADVQKSAKIKGFRQGHVPMTIIKQQFGRDVQHELYHTLIDESLRKAVQENGLRTVGRAQIDGEDEHHAHQLEEGKDLSYTATIEIIPEVEVKGYTGISVTREKVEVKDSDVDTVVNSLLDEQAQLVPMEDARGVKNKDFIDMTFAGKVKEGKEFKEWPGLSGTRMVEVGSNSLIPGFEENLVGLKAGETKTFEIDYPKEFAEAGLAGKQGQFTVTVNSIKSKKLPELTDEFVKAFGVETVAEFRAKAKENILKERESTSERKLRNDLITALIEKNDFEVPNGLIDAQTRLLAEDGAQNMTKQGASQEVVAEILKRDLPELKKTAERQVRASLILDAIGKAEKIEVTQADIDAEYQKISEQAHADLERVREFYEKTAGRKEDLIFRMKEDKTMAFLIGKSKVK